LGRLIQAATRLRADTITTTKIILIKGFKSKPKVKN